MERQLPPDAPPEGNDADNACASSIAGAARAPRRSRWPLLGRLGWFSTTGFLLVTMVSAWFVLSRVEEQARRDVESVLSTVLRTTHEAMRYLTSEYERDAENWASSPELIQHVEALLRAPRTRDDLVASDAQSRLRTLLRPINDKRGYIGIFVIAPDYLSLASMRDTNIGSTNLLVEQGDFLDRVFHGETLLSRPMVSDVPLPDASGELVEGQTTMFVATPVHNKAREVIAVLTFRIVPTQDFTRVARLGRIGDTGDTYVFDRSGKLLTESLFEDQLREIGLLAADERDLLSVEIRDPGGNMMSGFRPEMPRAQQPLTRMAAAAVAGTSGVDLRGYRDYRGVLVVGAWRWDDTLGFGMATEMDYGEAYRAFQNTRLLMLSGLALITGLFVSLTAVLATGRTRALHLAEAMTVALRESEHRYRMLVQTAGNVIVCLSPNHRILEFNHEAERIHGQRRDDVLGKDYFDMFVPQENYETYVGIMERVLAGEPSRSFESPVQSSEGGQSLLLWNFTRLLDDDQRPVGIIAVGQDVTERKLAEQRALLAERLAAIGQVITGLAHESRNALARSQACLEMLAQRVGDQDEAMDLIGRMQNAQRHLLRLYEGVREYAAPIKLDRRRYDLGEILNDVWDDLASERDGRDVKFHVEASSVDLCCEVDRMSVGQVFRNVLENSLSACSDPVQIGVSWTESEIDGAEAVGVGLHNNGPPLSPEEQERAFEAFYTTKTRGTGLGMTICRRIVEAHGGRIALGDVTDGVEVVVTLPRFPSPLATE